MGAQIHLPGEGRSLATVGVSVLLKTSAEETDGRWTLYEYTAPAQFAGPPPHWHRETDEAFFVLEGTIRFEVGGDSVDAPAGGYARVPPGVVHRFSNPFDEPARFLGLLVPGGFEQYWVELAELMTGAPSWPPEDMAPVLELQAKYDTFPPPAPSTLGLVRADDLVSEFAGVFDEDVYPDGYLDRLRREWP